MALPVRSRHGSAPADEPFDGHVPAGVSKILVHPTYGGHRRSDATCSNPPDATATRL